REEREQHDDPLDREPERVDHHRPAEHAHAVGGDVAPLDGGVAPQHDDERERRGGREQGQDHLDRAPDARGHERLDEHADDAGAEHDEDRGEVEPVDRGGHEGVVHDSLPSSVLRVTCDAWPSTSVPSASANGSERGGSSTPATARSDSVTSAGSRTRSSAGAGYRPRTRRTTTSGATTHFSRAPRSGSSSRPSRVPPVKIRW